MKQVLVLLDGGQQGWCWRTDDGLEPMSSLKADEGSLNGWWTNLAASEVFFFDTWSELIVIACLTGFCFVGRTGLLLDDAGATIGFADGSFEQESGVYGLSMAWNCKVGREGLRECCWGDSMMESVIFPLHELNNWQCSWMHCWVGMDWSSSPSLEVSVSGESRRAKDVHSYLFFASDAATDSETLKGSSHASICSFEVHIGWGPVLNRSWNTPFNVGILAFFSFLFVGSSFVEWASVFSCGVTEAANTLSLVG